jgi:lysyl-tRNA synthetase class 2
MATSWVMASKALRPLPTLHKELSEESRVRQRYADLVVRQEARDMVRTKATLLRAVRATLDGEGFVEVETPVLQLIHGGAAARPFGTHMNAFDQDMSLRIALELNLKKAVVGGVDKVYEMGGSSATRASTRRTRRSSRCSRRTRPTATSAPSPS